MVNIFSNIAENQDHKIIEPTHGEIPEDIKGVYLKNGPGSLQAGGRILDHWFDGFSYIHCIKFDNGSCSHQARYLESKGFEAFKKNNQIKYPLFKSVPRYKWFEYIREFIKGRQSGNNSAVSIQKIADRYFALTESKGMSEIEIKNLALKKHFEFEDDLNSKSKLTSAHPIYDKQKDEHINFELIPGPTNTFGYYSINNKSLERTKIGEIKSKFLPYVHSFGLTKNYIIHIDYPLVVFPVSLKLRFGWISYSNAFKWMPGPCKKTKITLLNRNTGKISKTYETDPFFAFHHLNAFETEDKIVFDLCQYRSNKIIKNLESEILLSTTRRTIEEPAIPMRYTLDLNSHQCEKEVLLNDHMEVATFNEELRFEECNYYYGVGSNRDSFDNSIIKINTKTKKRELEWSEEDTFAGESIFIKREGLPNEDDGYLLNLVHRAEVNKSYLLCLNASNFNEVFRIPVPGSLIPSVHGAFFHIN